MESVTIDLSGLNGLLQFGELGWIGANLGSALVFGLLCWRSITRAGKYHGITGDRDEVRRSEMVANAHVAKAIVTGAVGVTSVIMLFVMSWSLFSQDLEFTKIARMNEIEATRLARADGYFFHDHNGAEVKVTTTRSLSFDEKTMLSEFFGEWRDTELLPFTLQRLLAMDLPIESIDLPLKMMTIRTVG